MFIYIFPPFINQVESQEPCTWPSSRRAWRFQWAKAWKGGQQVWVLEPRRPPGSSQGDSAADAPGLPLTAGRVPVWQSRKEITSAKRGQCAPPAGQSHTLAHRIARVSCPRPRTFIDCSYKPGTERQGSRAGASKDREERCFVSPLRENKHFHQNNPWRSQRRLLRRACLRAFESLPPFRMCLWAGDYEVAEKVLPPQAASCEPAERTALSAGAEPAPAARPRAGGRGGGARRDRDGFRGDRAQRRPARAPGLPQGADEAVDRALRVQGHDVPYVEEAGHFIRHAASCSRADVPPLLCALAALSGEPPRQRRSGAHDGGAESGGGGHCPSGRGSGLSPARRRGSRPRAKLPLQTPRAVRRPGTPRAAAAASPAGFLFLSEVFSPTPLLLLLPPPLPLRLPSPLGAPPRPSPPPRGSWWCRAPRSPRGNFWTRWWCPLGAGEERRLGRRGREANQGAAAGGGAGRGRDDAGEAGPPGQPRLWPRGPGRRRSARRRWRGDEGGIAALEGPALGCDSPCLGKRRMAESRPVPGASRGQGGWEVAVTGEEGREGPERWNEPARRLEMERRSRGGVGGVGLGNRLTKGEEGVEVKEEIEIKNKYMVKKDNRKGESEELRPLFGACSFGFCLKYMALVKLDPSADVQVDASLQGGERHLAEPAIFVANRWRWNLLLRLQGRACGASLTARRGLTFHLREPAVTGPWQSSFVYG